MSAPLVAMLKLARAAALRGASVDAAEALDAALVLAQQTPPMSTARALAVAPADFAAMCGWSGKHVARMIKRGEVETIGSGRALRVLVAESIAKLRATGEDVASASNEPESEDAIEALGAEHARRRARLHVVPRSEP